MFLVASRAAVPKNVRPGAWSEAASGLRLDCAFFPFFVSNGFQLDRERPCLTRRIHTGVECSSATRQPFGPRCAIKLSSHLTSRAVSPCSEIDEVRKYAA